MKWTSERQLRRRCDAALRGIEIPAPWDLDGFLRSLGDRRGREIVLAEAPELTNSVSAKWWKDRDRDFIFYAPTQSVFYLELNVFHEVGHMLCGHDHPSAGQPFAGGDMEALTTAPDAARTIFSRSSRFDSVEEREAEFIAYRLKLLIEQRHSPSADDDDPATAHLRQTMRRTLGSSAD